ncbi:thioredoxin family protein [Lacihabitans sp. CCS-44]|uniref:redoxin domain-containing protein n=1 Tax=Lacihabitans sp. CCS-44 TaxID=2487331 RepID=UPI0020CD9FEE|nr:redoxin domain-containing protein [Lacihabitans sp. CCS-44]MCP9755962.1 thioredoxin family protein [Lacihabitans sp. CCS-44]
MKILVLFLLSFIFSGGETPVDPPINSKAIDFSLKNTDGKTVSLDSFEDSKGVILVFLTNNCPIAKMYQNRVKELQSKYGKMGFPVVAIDPTDSMSAMKSVASEKGFNFEYLQDADQKVSFAYGAVVNTHTVILVKKRGSYKIAYIGAIDDNRDETKITTKYVETAIGSILVKEEIKVNSTIAKGCVITYRK